jgi:uncharacterized membrane protein YozB (DUF420 family)
MSDNKDYLNLSLEELIEKQKSITNWQKIFIGIAVVSVAMTLYAVYKDNIGKHAFFILGSLFLILNNGTKLKKVQLEIEKRKN